MRPILYILIALLISSCGIIKKTRTKHVIKDRSELEHVSDSSFTRIDTSKTETTEKINIVFRIGKDRVNGNDIQPEATEKKPDLRPVTQREALRDLIDRSEEITVTVDKKTVQESGIFEEIRSKETRRESKDIRERVIEKHKDSDTRFSTNFAWYYILIIVSIIAIIIYIFTKKFKIGTILRGIFSRKPP